MGERAQAPCTVHGPTTVKDGGDSGGDGGDGCAQTTHPAPVTLPSEDHVKALPSNTLLGPVVPSYVAPFTISLSKPVSVLKAVALKS